MWNGRKFCFDCLVDIFCMNYLGLFCLFVKNIEG